MYSSPVRRPKCTTLGRVVRPDATGRAEHLPRRDALTAVHRDGREERVRRAQPTRVRDDDVRAHPRPRRRSSPRRGPPRVTAVPGGVGEVDAEVARPVAMRGRRERAPRPHRPPDEPSGRPWRRAAYTGTGNPAANANDDKTHVHRTHEHSTRCRTTQTPGGATKTTRGVRGEEADKVPATLAFVYTRRATRHYPRPMPNAGSLVGAARHVIDRTEARLVPRDLSARFTTASADAAHALEAAWRKQGHDGAAYESTTAARLQRDRVALIPWLDRTRRLRSSHIIEVGCGRGASTVALSEQGAHVTALDQSAAALTIAELRAAGHRVPVEFIEGDAAELDRLVGGRPVDWIIFWASLEHMTVPERLAALTAAWNTLPPGGLLTLVETPNRLWFTDSHTSYLPYFNWLPDELALRYARFSSRADHPQAGERPGRARAPRPAPQRPRRQLPRARPRDRTGGRPRRRQLHAARTPSPQPVRAAGWRWSRPGRYEAMLRKISPEVPRARSCSRSST